MLRLTASEKRNQELKLKHKTMPMAMNGRMNEQTRV
jgi:hypothetical protein